MRFRSLLIYLVLPVAFLAGCVFDRTYDVEGRIVGFGNDGRTVLLTHREIPGFMPSMTMSFSVQDTVRLDAFAVGDELAFTLAVTPTRSFIYGLRRLPPGTLTDLTDETYTPSPRTSTEEALLSPGDPAPSFALMDQDGSPLTMSRWPGKSVLLTFIYTRCPLPEYCPLLSRRFQTLQPRIRERFGDKVQLLSISIDPEYDTPDVLRAYARRYTNDTDHWTFATGPKDQIRALADRYGVYYDRDGADPAALIHNLTTALIGSDGRVYAIWRGSTWETADVLNALEDLRTTDRLSINPQQHSPAQ